MVAVPSLSDADADRRRDGGLQQRRGEADASAVTASGNIVIAVPGVFAGQRHSESITTWYDNQDLISPENSYASPAFPRRRSGFTPYDAPAETLELKAAPS
jgi:hypothetical protein